MIKIAHEAPINIINNIRRHTDYSYALVHLLEEEPEYLKYFEERRDAGDEVILDNSIFELGEAFDADKYVDWIYRLQPTWYIIPDVLEDLRGTQMKARLWKEWKDAPGKTIGVVQGKNYRELIECYNFMDQEIEVDKIAISFDYSYYLDSVPSPNKWISYMLGRVKFIGDLVKDGVINKRKPHHLLGVALPQEGLFYKEAYYDFIDSMDTSNPIVHGIKRMPYPGHGLFRKETQKLFELINYQPSTDQMVDILSNVMQFKKWWN